MELDLAIKRVRIVQRIHPDWLVCGSLGMILLGEIPEREIHDLDFATCYPPRGRFLKRIENQNQNWKNIARYYGKMKKGLVGYVHFKIGFPENCCLFILDYIVKPVHCVRGLKIQQHSQMSYYKKMFDRKKDKKDLAVTDI